MYQVAGGIWVIRVSDREGDFIRASTGTPDKPTAEAYEAMLTTFYDQQRWDVLDAIVAGVLKLQQVFWHHRQNTLDSLMASLTDADLDKLVDEWAPEVEGTRYVQQVRTLIKEGEPFPASEFRRKRISQFLASLKKQRKGSGTVSPSTKKRYKAGLSQFAKWLIEREIIDTNPVRDVASIKQKKADPIWLPSEDVKRLINALPAPYNALEAVMANGMEWQAVVAVRTKEDVKPRDRAIYANGGKNKYRKRWVVVTEAWTWPIIKAHIAQCETRLLFEGISHDEALSIHHATAESLGLPRTRLHHHRHSYAVNFLKRGGLPQVVKSQLGHAPNSTVVETTYAPWIVSKEDFRSRRK